MTRDDLLGEARRLLYDSPPRHAVDDTRYWAWRTLVEDWIRRWEVHLVESRRPSPAPEEPDRRPAPPGQRRQRTEA